MVASRRLPTVSVFYGIVIAMFFDEHPPPHFHARYSGHRARVAIADGRVLDGDLPPRVARLVREWAELRRAELEANWARVEAGESLERIEPLP